MEIESPEMISNKFRHDINCLSDSVQFNIIVNRIELLEKMD